MVNLKFKQKILLAAKYPQTAGNTFLDGFLAKNNPTVFPRLISCFITERCNFNCPMCHVRQSRQKIMTDLTFVDFKKIIDESKKYHPSFQLVGGEPLLNRDIFRVIRYLAKNKMVKSLVTNGLLLEENADELVDSGLDFLGISLDGPDEKTQYQRGLIKGSFSKITKGIKKVLTIRGKKPFPNIRIATVITKDNLDNFDQILSLSQELGADQWSLSHHFYYNEKIKKAQLEFSRKYNMGEEVWGEYIGKRKELFNRKERQKIKNKYRFLTEVINNGGSPIKISLQETTDIDKYYQGVFPSQESVCTSPYNQIFIRGNGNVEICQGYILGNLKNQNLYGLWHGKRAEHFRQIFQKAGVMPACFRCCALDIKF